MNRPIILATFTLILLFLGASTVIVAQAVQPDDEVQPREAEQQKVVKKEEPWEKAGREVREAVAAVSEASRRTWNDVEKQTKEIWKKIIEGSAAFWYGDKEIGQESEESGKEQGTPGGQTFWQRSKKAMNDMYNSVITEIQKFFSSKEKEKEKKEKAKA